MFAEFLMGQASQALYPWASIWLLKSTSIQPGFFFTGPISFYVLPIILSVDTANRVFVVLLSPQSVKGIL